MYILRAGRIVGRVAKLRRGVKWVNSWDWLYRDWAIIRRGGFSMVRHYTARKGEGFIVDWKLRDLVALIDKVEAGETIPDFNKRTPYI